MSVTKSQRSFLLGSGSSVVSTVDNRAKQAYSTFPFIKIIHSLHAFALIQEYRKLEIFIQIFVYPDQSVKNRRPGLERDFISHKIFIAPYRFL